MNPLAFPRPIFFYTFSLKRPLSISRQSSGFYKLFPVPTTTTELDSTTSTTEYPTSTTTDMTTTTDVFSTTTDLVETTTDLLEPEVLSDEEGAKGKACADAMDTKPRHMLAVREVFAIAGSKSWTS